MDKPFALPCMERDFFLNNTAPVIFWRGLTPMFSHYYWNLVGDLIHHRLEERYCIVILVIFSAFFFLYFTFLSKEIQQFILPQELQKLRLNFSEVS